MHYFRPHFEGKILREKYVGCNPTSLKTGLKGLNAHKTVDITVYLEITHVAYRLVFTKESGFVRFMSLLA